MSMTKATESEEENSSSSSVASGRDSTLVALKELDTSEAVAEEGPVTPQHRQRKNAHFAVPPTPPQSPHNPYEIKSKLESSASVKSDPGTRRPLFNVGVGEDDEDDEDVEEEAMDELAEEDDDAFPATEPRRMHGLGEKMGENAPARRKITVVRHAPVQVVPMETGPGEAPGRRAGGPRYHSDSIVNYSPMLHFRDPTGKHMFRRPIVERWRSVVQRALSQDDPWKELGLHTLAPASCLRHRYSSIRKKWVVDRVEIKMEAESFAKGAMRKCFRLKKLSAKGHFKNNDWAHALNYVAKSYMETVEKEVYFEDVKLQMDAKLWAEEYNRHRPPKKVDIFQISILEFEKEDGGSEYYHLEHFIEGEYIKYNSNSGFVDDIGRKTPQAFSHFTFERSGHQQIVVDVQGVGDLYTDPQIHTVTGTDYGDGNLGTKGMALFFHSHECNDICSSMGLTPFNLAPSEVSERRKRLLSRQVSVHENSKTVCKNLSKLCESVEPDAGHIIDFLRHRTISERSRSGSDELEDDGSLPSAASQHSPTPRHHHSPHSMHSEMDSLWSVIEPEEANEAAMEAAPPEIAPEPMHPPAAVSRRARFESYLDCSVSLCSGEESANSSLRAEKAERDAYWNEMRKMSKPAGLGSSHELQAFLEKVREEDRAKEKARRNRDSVLGRVHLDIARYHELGRFLDASEDGPGEFADFDKAGAWFHLDMAAKCGVVEALLTCARIYLGLPHDILSDFNLESIDEEEKNENEDQGLDYVTEAAEAGDLGSMLFLGAAFRSGAPLGTERAKSYGESRHWYERALEAMGEEEEGAGDTANALATEPRYQIQASLAEMYLEGGQGLEKDPMKAGDLFNEAAEGAMEAGKGKLSTKLFARAEEAWAEVEEEEEPTEE